MLVLNGDTVIARQGDPVDLDGNGTYDDGYTIDVFNNDGGFLTEDGVFYLTATLNAKGVNVGQAFLRYDISGLTPRPGDIAGAPANGSVDAEDLAILLAAWVDCD